MNRERELERLARDLELHRERLAFIIRRMGAEPRHIDDLVQNTLVTAFKNLHKYQDRGLMFSWLCRIAYNEFRTHLRKKEEWDAQLDEEHDKPGELEEPYSPFREAIRDCISELPRNQQTMLILSIDNSSREIAEIFKKTVGAVNTALSRAREDVRKCVQGKDFPLEEFK